MHRTIFSACKTVILVIYVCCISIEVSAAPNAVCSSTKEPVVVDVKNELAFGWNGEYQGFIVGKIISGAGNPHGECAIREGRVIEDDLVVCGKSITVIAIHENAIKLVVDVIILGADSWRNLSLITACKSSCSEKKCNKSFHIDGLEVIKATKSVPI